METFDVTGNCLHPLILNGQEGSAVPTTYEELSADDIIILFFNSNDMPAIKILVSITETHIEIRQLNPAKQLRIERIYINRLLKVVFE